jgi:hypothetical protein
MIVNTNSIRGLAMKCVHHSIALIALAMVIADLEAPLLAQEVPAPPAIGDNTRGEPAELIDTINTSEQSATNQTAATEETDPIETSYRREGHLYELKVSPRIGADQYILDENKDGKIQRVEEGLDTSNANIPKWKIGSF